VLSLATALAVGAARADKPKFVPPPPAPSVDDTALADLAGARWAPDGVLPKGAEVALIGYETPSGGATTYSRFPAGYHLPAHKHVHPTYYTMVAGKGTFTLNGKRSAAEPGLFVVTTGKDWHELTCDAGAACVFIVRHAGPPDLTWQKAPAK
jgi:quercetin dioxygenase-like cupin family protein